MQVVTWQRETLTQQTLSAPTREAALAAGLAALGGPKDFTRAQGAPGTATRVCEVERWSRPAGSRDGFAEVSLREVPADCGATSAAELAEVLRAQEARGAGYVTAGGLGRSLYLDGGTGWAQKVQTAGGWLRSVSGEFVSWHVRTYRRDMEDTDLPAAQAGMATEIWEALTAPAGRDLTAEEARLLGAWARLRKLPGLFVDEEVDVRAGTVVASLEGLQRAEADDLLAAVPTLFRDGLSITFHQPMGETREEMRRHPALKSDADARQIRAALGL
jgi:hypothetical protein